LPLAAIFIVTTIVCFVVPLQSLWNMSAVVMIAGNCILFLATAISFSLLTRSLTSNNVQVFLRMIYGSMFAKMMIVLFAALLYIGIVKKGVSKGAVFGCMFLYFVYTFTEIGIIMKLSRKNRYVKN
jgi:hypothetical protein